MPLSTVLRNDIDIQENVLRELEWDPRVEQSEVGVQVDRGIVTLRGNITSYVKKLAAKEAAPRVAGVLDVVNDLQVTLPDQFARTDQDIARAVREALEWNALVPHDRIRSTVTDGLVTLEGEVTACTQRLDAERAVEHLAGVKGVDNRIVTKPQTAPEPARVCTAIQEALDRQARREASRVGLAVSADGIVTMTGTVRSWTERNAIHDMVAHSPGVRRVVDRLSVDPHY